jgi:membrane protein implicated in regulation of membrane protease activity
VVSTAETIGATGLALFAIVLPVLALAVVVLLVVWLVRRIRRSLARRRDAQSRDMVRSGPA